MKKIILIVFLSLGPISSAFSSIQDAYDAFDKQDYKTAFNQDEKDKLISKLQDQITYRIEKELK